MAWNWHKYSDSLHLLLGSRIGASLGGRGCHRHRHRHRHAERESEVAKRFASLGVLREEETNGSWNLQKYPPSKPQNA